MISVPDQIRDKLSIQGQGRSLLIKPPVHAERISIYIEDGASVVIGSDCWLGHLEIHATRGSSVVIGDGCGFGGAVRLLLHEANSIEIGRGCLISASTDITVSDMHSIIDLRTGQRINHASDVKISDRVWIGTQCLVLKGATIGSGSIIGARSLVTGEIPENCCAAGTPAKVIRRDVTWDYSLAPAPAQDLASSPFILA